MNYELCSVPLYKINYPNTKKINKPIDTLESVLITDLQLHERLGKNDNLKLSVDVDKLRLHNPNETLENIFNNLSEFLHIDKSEISYTTNFSIDAGSHHVVIPKYFMNSSSQKQMWYDFRNQYNYGKEIDADIFGKDGWFRLPNQTKERVAGTEHIIQHGELNHFVLKYIENATLYIYEPNIDDKTTEDDLWSNDGGSLVSDCSSITCDLKNENPDKYLELLFDVIGNNKQQINWDTWFQIAGCLKSNEYDKSIFLKYSQPNDVLNTASSVWDGIKKSSMNIHTLQNIAKKINFSKYKQWLNKYEKCLYDQIFTTGLIADYFKLLYGDKFIRVDDIIYMFNGVFWNKCDKKNTELVNFIDKTFVADLFEYANEYMAKYTMLLTSSQNSDVIKDKLEKIGKFIVSINKMRNSAIRKPIIEDITTFITNNDIKFDSNPYLFAFTNAVYDLKLNKFVEHNPLFYITKTSGYLYDFSYSKDNIKVLDELIDTIFPDKEVKEYYLGILSTGLCGLQIENCFIATGSGGNGKSLINSLMMKTGGEYAYKLPSDVLLSAIKTGPNPEVANIHNVRFLLTQEPTHNKKMNSSTVKELTGDKTLNVRQLYSGECSINLRNTTLIEANTIPLIDEVNGAVLRRMRTIPFTSKYVEKSVYDSLDDKTNVFIADSYYKTDEFQHTYKQALFDLLIQRFKSFVENKHSLPPQPKCCSDKCADYLGTCDDIIPWFETHYEKTDTLENSEAIPLKDIYDVFSSSTYFNNLNKNDKRKYNKKYFLNKLEENVFLSSFIRFKNTRYKLKKQTTDYIIGWKEIDTFFFEDTEEFLVE